MRFTLAGILLNTDQRRTRSKDPKISLLLVNLHAIAAVLLGQVTGSVRGAQRLGNLGHAPVKIEHTDAHAGCKHALPVDEAVATDPFADLFGHAYAIARP